MADATIVITTKNRGEELANAVRSAIEQVGAVVEVIVIDDGSTDGSAEMIRRDFPTVRLERFEQSSGLIVQRNHGARLATAAIIFSIDDDAVFSTPHVVAQTLHDFDDPTIGAVAIPCINVRQDKQVQQRAPDDARIYVTKSFIGTAHALRRNLFLQLNGYREFLIHQGEEGDFCIRMLEAGYFVRLGRADPIHHFESPLRSTKRMIIYGRRNEILYAWYNVPFPLLTVHLAVNLLKGILFMVPRGYLGWMVEGTAQGIASLPSQFSERRPVSRRTYWLSRELQKPELHPLADMRQGRGAHWLSGE